LAEATREFVEVLPDGVDDENCYPGLEAGVFGPMLRGTVEVSPACDGARPPQADSRLDSTRPAVQQV
jgi:hypothetical protein